MILLLLDTMVDCHKYGVILQEADVDERFPEAKDRLGITVEFQKLRDVDHVNLLSLVRNI